MCYNVEDYGMDRAPSILNTWWEACGILHNCCILALDPVASWAQRSSNSCIEKCEKGTIREESNESLNSLHLTYLSQILENRMQTHAEAPLWAFQSLNKWQVLRFKLYQFPMNQPLIFACIYVFIYIVIYTHTKKNLYFHPYLCSINRLLTSTVPYA